MNSDFDDDEFDDESEDLAPPTEIPSSTKRNTSRTLTHLHTFERTSYLLGINEDASSVVAVGGTGRDVFGIASNRSPLKFEEIKTPGPGLRDVHVEGDRIIVCGEYGYVAISEDRGKNFRKVDVNAGSSCMHGVRVDATGALWLVGDRGVMIRSEDWESFRHLQTNTKANLGKIRRYSNGMLCASSDGGLYTVSNGRITRTALNEDGIVNTPVETPKGAFLAVGQYGIAVRSQDSGASYQSVQGIDIGRTDLSAVAVMKDNTIAFVGMSGLLAVSEDDGKTFAKVEQDLTHDNFWSCMAWGDGLLIGTQRGSLFYYA